ncbi:hypothetical protein, variant 3 [Aphanomyces invadans]|uniref:Cation-transporting ATPase n=1 Tax=Aphanomyces invadans TaxID=157072 RepID=A0A024UNJ8_9STRA|nr:hypothetical protein, variant 2 [Aphanomyces invadans]XP_008863319.1 hypothetical protein, variant 3 [Aphanomyces invadans]ETW07212.1 hypothetical protein, variant 2 [Aphanomyces invadans]ETW07213.1 hypothetical protein, variant 3 [Aphanomyces invadans]|eukprot:XP_008863318.1 hypothetical protein, variant 2 [Aphanomyces invadans]
MKKRSSDAEDTATLLDPSKIRIEVPLDPTVGTMDLLRCGGSSASTTVLFLPSEFRAIRLYRNGTWWKQGIYAVLCVASCGVLPLLAYYMPLLHAACTLTPLSSGVFATIVLVQHRDSAGSWEAVPVQRTSMNTRASLDDENGHEWIWFTFRKHRYVYIDATASFRRISATVHGLSIASDVVPRLQTGLSDDMAAALLRHFGPNALDIALVPYHRVLMSKLLHPFYLFQLTSVFLWMYEEYWTYSILILGMTIGSLGYEVSTQVRNTKKLHDLMHMDDIFVKVLRNNQRMSLPATALVLGDVVELDEGGGVAADMVLVEGACAMDESSLTGEAIPVDKHALPFDTVIDSITTSSSKIKASLLSAGSTVVRMDAAPCKAVVVAVGFHTSKGDLFRSIVCPKPIRFQVEQDSYRFLAALSTLAVLTGIKNSYDAAMHGLGWTRILVSCLDLVTIAVPPALPLILSVGVGYSIHRLQRDGIFCIDGPKINLAGHLNCFCFDKTGTLTTDAMKFQGIDLAVSTSAAASTCVDVSADVDARSVAPLPGTPMVPSFEGMTSLHATSSSEMLHGAGTCHGVISAQGVLVGSPLEVSLFQASKHVWDEERNVIECRTTGCHFEYAQKFAFDSTLQRSSVVLKDGTVFVKGSPEAVAQVCLSNTLPLPFHTTVHDYAKRGLYCMGLATKQLPMMHFQSNNGQMAKSSLIPRGDVESGLTFVGLLLFTNPIKPESPALIATLEAANIDVRIITGDSALTAVHVAQELAMDLRPQVVLLDVNHGGHSEGERNALDAETPTVVLRHVDSGVMEPYSMDAFLTLGASVDFAMTGAALEWFQERGVGGDVVAVVDTIKIFARIRPEQKTWLVETLMAQGKYVGMCGDGTNDCGALKAAHVGLALSNAEASIVAPFTSRQQNVMDVVTLIREGRCALTTSYLGFKFMVLYPVTQVIVTSTLYSVMVTLGNNQFLLDDMVIVLGLSMFMLYTEPTHVLARHEPASTLFARSIVWSIVGHVLIFLACFTATWSAGRHVPTDDFGRAFRVFRDGMAARCVQLEHRWLT